MSETDLTFLTVDVAGRRLALWSDGTVLPIIRGADEGEGEGEGENEGDGDTGADKDTGDDPEVLKLTQAELDAMIEKRQARDRAKWEKETKDAAEKAKMDEATRLTAEKAEAEAKATEATARANTRLVTAEAKLAAAAAGVPADRVAAFVKLADLSDIEVDDDGEIDAKALTKVVKSTLDANPFLKATPASGKSRSGGDFSAAGDGKSPPKNLEDAITARLGAA
jgi:hypothetical protein